MSKGHSPRKYDPVVFGENFDRIFRKDDPMRSLVPGAIRVWRSECCGVPVDSNNRCLLCFLVCNSKLVEINQ